MDVLPDHARNGHRTHEAHHDSAFAFHFDTTKDTKNAKDYRMKRLMQFCSFVTLKLISKPSETLASRIYVRIYA